MSWSNAPTIQAGDLVILWLTHTTLQPLTITPGETWNSKFGYYPHDELIGKRFGSKVASKSRDGKGFIHILRPTPHLWTLSLPHRTQILYDADIGFITSWLDIKRGSVVVEAGTGSGSFSHHLLHTIGSSGHLHTYEFHETRVGKAKEEFQRHGFDSSRVTLTHRNVCKDGFTIEGIADSVFLDLPAPWDAIPHAKKALRNDKITRICCFSPCIEQVLRTVTTLNDEGFFEITTYETLLRPYEISPSSPLPTIFDAANKIKESERKREEKRIMQVKGGHRGTSGKQEKEKKRKLEDGEESDNKRAKTEENEVEGTGESVKQEEPEPEPVIVSEPAQTLETELQGSTTPTVLARVMPEVRGHTSYLTFAVLLPALPSEEKSVQRETANGELVGQIDEQVESEDVKMMEA
ncbi:trna methyltransferase complex subunit cpd1 [Moniliophthora roreri MCA 2997]|uniref:tRNA (adenine(58)-N(1))-methyltransferase catalytic subunit TRM61 n=1 Tax=Moniliophthora roreri (strain MCA 2997) TaxID=1381753 RepID=V2WQZ3_MONRO|nr:trna methyltransferase complex subunit cpd1 [Moniliophthora roreri MCA 2997]